MVAAAIATFIVVNNEWLCAYSGDARKFRCGARALSLHWVQDEGLRVIVVNKPSDFLWSSDTATTNTSAATRVAIMAITTVRLAVIIDEAGQDRWG